MNSSSKPRRRKIDVDGPLLVFADGMADAAQQYLTLCRSLGYQMAGSTRARRDGSRTARSGCSRPGSVTASRSRPSRSWPGRWSSAPVKAGVPFSLGGRRRGLWRQPEAPRLATSTGRYGAAAIRQPPAATALP